MAVAAHNGYECSLCDSQPYLIIEARIDRGVWVYLCEECIVQAAQLALTHLISDPKLKGSKASKSRKRR